MKFLVLDLLPMNKMIKKKYKAFSILEMLVTMAIFAILIVMLLNSLLLNIKLSTKINIRSTVRSNIDELVTQIERDIRNADSIDPKTCRGNSCIINIEGVNYVWEKIDGDSYITRKIKNAPFQNEVFNSSPNIYIKKISFNVLSSDQDIEGGYRFVNVIVTLEAESNAAQLGCEKDQNNNGCSNADVGDTQWVENQVRHFSVSTRNYLIN